MAAVVVRVVGCLRELMVLSADCCVCGVLGCVGIGGCVGAGTRGAGTCAARASLRRPRLAWMHAEVSDRY